MKSWNNLPRGREKEWELEEHSQRGLWVGAGCGRDVDKKTALKTDRPDFSFCSTSNKLCHLTKFAYFLCTSFSSPAKCK